MGVIKEGIIVLSDLGKVVEEEWIRTGVIRPHIIIDAFTIMPNHLHGILTISRGTLQRAPTKETFGHPTSDSIPTIIRLFKSATTKRINLLRGTPGFPVWQRNYYEHIVRNDIELYNLREYIIHNPANRGKDDENPLILQDNS